MRDLVADVVELHGPLPLAAALLENQCQAVLEAQAREPTVVRIVQGPSAAIPPVLVRLRVADGIPARIVDVRLQLAPGQYEPGLVVEFPLACDAVPLVVLAGRGGLSRKFPRNLSIRSYDATMA